MVLHLGKRAPVQLLLSSLAYPPASATRRNSLRVVVRRAGGRAVFGSSVGRSGVFISADFTWGAAVRPVQQRAWMRGPFLLTDLEAGEHRMWLAGVRCRPRFELGTRSLAPPAA